MVERRGVNKERLKRARDASGLSREKVAEAIGCSAMSIYSYETGRRKNPRSDILGQLAAFYGEPIEVFLEGDDLREQAAAIAFHRGPPAVWAFYELLSPESQKLVNGLIERLVVIETRSIESQQEAVVPEQNRARSD